MLMAFDRVAVRELPGEWSEGLMRKSPFKNSAGAFSAILLARLKAIANRLLRASVPKNTGHFSPRSRRKTGSQRMAAAVAGFLFLAVWTQPVKAGGGPENCLLIINRGDRSSLLIANHYAHLRHIPAVNRVYLDQIPKQGTLSLADFREKILRPIFQAVRERNLEQQIDLVVYSSGFPAAVNVQPLQQAFFDRIAENGTAINEQNKRLFHPRASLTSMTYFALAVLADQPAFFSLSSNHYYRGPCDRLLAQPFVGEPQAEYEQAVAQLASRETDAAIETLVKLQKAHPAQVAVAYQLARAYALKQDEGQTAEWILAAVRAGFIYRGQILEDPAFESLKSRPRIAEVLALIPEERFDFLTSQGFTSRSLWGPNGSLNSTPDQGASYLLSTLLSYTWDSGISERASVEFLKRTVAADSTYPRGRFYFTLTSNVRTTTRRAGFAPAIAKLKRLGYEAEQFGKVAPIGRTDILGAMLGERLLNWPDYGCRLQPGSIVENLTSLGATFPREPVHTQCTEFLKFGAAGSSGTVVEPFALQQKFPHPLIHVHYVRGCNLAEAFYQSVEGPSQLLIVGDALCQPWAEPPRFEVRAPGGPWKGKISIALNPTEQGPEVSQIELFLDGRLVQRRLGLQNINIDSSSWSDGYHELRIVAIGAAPIQARSRAMIPVSVNNRGQSIQLQSDRSTYDENDTITVRISSSLEGQLKVWQGAEVLGAANGQEAEFTLAAGFLGRGPVSLQATCQPENGDLVRSQPLTFEVSGELAERPEPLPKTK